MKLKIKKTHPDAILPTRATDGAACFDLYALGTKKDHPSDSTATVFQTGLAFEVPRGYAMLIFSRSGHGFKDAIRLSNCVGVIDSDYRGEVQVSLRFEGKHTTRPQRGERIAQFMLVASPDLELEETLALSSTARGTGGFGSTGA
ncbi:hypothetical protein WK13_34550 [Burkholderia ubonensis]|uniref:dUTP diphosphatase n=1 Tax=Burkholderia ubonensis TaxID=101571 RepID=UPI0007524DEB|nr:dUTP diphosphatase [Burkholderia ubonensis]KVR21660.1 hypothetical protein WK13_34550 [Burkholderia ubonensis]